MLYTKVSTGQQDRINYARESVTFSHDFYTIGVLVLELINPDLIKYFRPQDATSAAGGSHVQQLT